MSGGADVVVTEDVWGGPFEALSREVHVERFPDAWSAPEMLPDLLSGARALVVRNRTRVTRDLLAALPTLQVVARAGVGLDNIDLVAADELGVVVVAALGANATSVAEFTLGTAIALTRRMLELDRSTRAGDWRRTAGRELAGGTWGLIGLGATGGRVARLAGALGMQVVAHDPYLAATDSGVPEGVRLASLPDTVRTADVLSIHVPATAKTRGMVDAELLSSLRPGAVLINVGRGEVVDEAALADAVESGHLGGAALDVRAAEPPVIGRLERLDNVLLTPHVAGITEQSQHRIAEILAADVAAVLAGRSADHAVGAARRASTGARLEPERTR